MSRARRQQYMLRTEASEQEAVITICKFMENRYPELKLLHHCPNGGKRDRVSAAVLKRQGVKAGVSAPSSAKRTVRKFIHRNEIRRWETAKGTERFFKTGSRLWKLRCSLLQPGDRAQSNRRICKAKSMGCHANRE